jgi:thioredoxin reductase (NADPH)
VATIETDHDVIVLGAGPSGATASTYLGRFGIKTLLLEALAAHATTPEDLTVRSTVSGCYYNVPGFPEGISREEFKWRGIQQAIHYGVEYRIDQVNTITRDGIVFSVHCDNQRYTARTLFFALGVEDHWPEVPGLDAYAGQSLYWSVETNGFEGRDKLSGVIGADDPAALEALRLFMMTGNAALFTVGEPLKCSDKLLAALEQSRIPIYTARVRSVVGKDGCLHALELANDDVIPVQVLFFPEPIKYPRSELAQVLGVHVDSAGFIQVNERFETNVPAVYAIGDMK